MNATIPDSLSFSVSDVDRAEEPLATIPYRKAVSLMVGGEVESCPSKLTNTLVGEEKYESTITAHSLMRASHLAFQDHRPLILSPDHLWQTVVQGVATHVNLNSAELRSQFVSHDGKQKIKVRRDEFIRGAMENDWQGVWPEFVDKLRTYIGPVADEFMPEFSTTGVVERAAAQVTLMDAMQSYFSYEVHTKCGIPQITLEGKTEDWVKLAEKAKAFGKYGLEWWTKPLYNLLRQFAQASEGSPNLTFWKSWYKWCSGSGGASIDGHIMTLFPYVREKSYKGPDGKWLTTPTFSLVKNKHLNRHVNSETYFHGPFQMDAVPSGLSKAPFVWEYYDNRLDYEFISGFVGVRQTDDASLRPEIGWAVRPAA